MLLPAYSALDARRDPDRSRAPLLNHIRVPLVLSGVVFLVYAPRILDRQPRNVVNALGVAPPDYLRRWLLLTAALFMGSLLLYASARHREDVRAAVRRKQRQAVGPSVVTRSRWRAASSVIASGPPGR